MNAFLGELGKKLAERWLTLLVLPGLLYLGAALIALALGHRHALDTALLARRAAALIASTRNATVLIELAAAGLLGGAALGLAAEALGQGFQRLWTLPGNRGPARWLTVWRRRRWDRAHAALRTTVAAVATSPPAERSGPLAERVAACRRIGLVRPERPTWIGDRWCALNARVHRVYALDIGAVWPRLWMVVPDVTRAEVAAAYDAYRTRARLAGWASLYVLLGVQWWPASIIGVSAGVVAWVRARAAVDVVTELAESAVDLHGRTLAQQLGLDGARPLDAETGRRITEAARKDGTLLGPTPPSGSGPKARPSS